MKVTGTRLVFTNNAFATVDMLYSVVGKVIDCSDFTVALAVPGNVADNVAVDEAEAVVDRGATRASRCSLTSTDKSKKASGVERRPIDARALLPFSSIDALAFKLDDELLAVLTLPPRPTVSEPSDDREEVEEDEDDDAVPPGVPPSSFLRLSTSEAEASGPPPTSTSLSVCNSRRSVRCTPAVRPPDDEDADALLLLVLTVALERVRPDMEDCDAAPSDDADEDDEMAVEALKVMVTACT